MQSIQCRKAYVSVNVNSRVVRLIAMMEKLGIMILLSLCNTRGGSERSSEG